MGWNEAKPVKRQSLEQPALWCYWGNSIACAKFFTGQQQSRERHAQCKSLGKSTGTSL